MINNPLIEYTLHLADNALVLGHRNSEWTGHGPVLEQDIAISNIALDLVGQARYFYQYAAELMGGGATEDSLAFLRDCRQYKNCLLVEQPNGDWARTVLRQFLFSAHQHLLFSELTAGKEPRLAAICEKALKEVTYHLRWSGEWVIRLGDGTEESHRRMLQAIEDLWEYTSELTLPSQCEVNLEHAGVIADSGRLRECWNKKVQELLDEATLPYPGPGSKLSLRWSGKEGLHSEHLGYLLAEMQFLQRAYPESRW